MGWKALEIVKNRVVMIIRMIRAVRLEIDLKSTFLIRALKISRSCNTDARRGGEACVLARWFSNGKECARFAELAAYAG